MWKREVVGRVVGESSKFGDLESGETAQQQSDQRDEDEIGSHFKARSQDHIYNIRALNSTAIREFNAFSLADQSRK